jgi:hypothetical protein
MGKLNRPADQRVQEGSNCCFSIWQAVTAGLDVAPGLDVAAGLAVAAGLDVADGL